MVIATTFTSAVSPFTFKLLEELATMIVEKFSPKCFGVVLDRLQLPHGRNLQYLGKNAVFKIWEQLINPKEIE